MIPLEQLLASDPNISADLRKALKPELIRVTCPVCCGEGTHVFSGEEERCAHCAGNGWIVTEPGYLEAYK